MGTPLSGIVLSLHGQLAVIWEPHPLPQATPVITRGHHVAQGVRWNHQGPAFRGSVLRGCV